MKFRRLRFFSLAIVVALPLVFLAERVSRSQDWLETGINRGAPVIRLAVTDFPALSTDQRLVPLAQEFNQVLHNDLDNAGIFQMVSKSYFPVKTPVEPGDVPITYADVGKASRLLAYSPKVPIREGLRRFAAWYRERHALPAAGAAVPATGERATP